MRAEDAHGSGEHSQGAGAARFPGSITSELDPNPKGREEGDEDEQKRAANPLQAFAHDEFARRFIESRAMCYLDPNGQCECAARYSSSVRLAACDEQERAGLARRRDGKGQSGP
jgi:hypothetical protein